MFKQVFVLYIFLYFCSADNFSIGFTYCCNYMTSGCNFGNNNCTNSFNSTYSESIFYPEDDDSDASVIFATFYSSCNTFWFFQIHYNQNTNQLTFTDQTNDLLVCSIVGYKDNQISYQCPQSNYSGLALPVTVTLNLSVYSRMNT